MTKILTVLFFSFYGVAFAQDNTAPVAVPNPYHLVIDSKDNLYVTVNYGILKITPTVTIVELRKQGIYTDEKRFGKQSMDRRWTNLVIDSKDNLYASDGGLLFKIGVTEDNRVSGGVYIGQIGSYRFVDGPSGTANFNTIQRMTIDKNDNIYVSDSYDKIAAEIDGNYVTDNYLDKAPTDRNRRAFSVLRKIDPSGIVTTIKTTERKYIVPNGLTGMTTDARGNIIYASGGFSRSIQMVDLASGVFSNVAGQPYSRQWCPVYAQGDTGKAELVAPEMIIVNKQGDVVFTDERLHRIILVANGRVSTLAGNSIIDPCGINIGGHAQQGNKDGKALTALFNEPKGIAYDSKGNLFIADMNNSSIRRLSRDGTVTTFAK